MQALEQAVDRVPDQKAPGENPKCMRRWSSVTRFVRPAAVTAGVEGHVIQSSSTRATTLPPRVARHTPVSLCGAGLECAGFLADVALELAEKNSR